MATESNDFDKVEENWEELQFSEVSKNEREKVEKTEICDFGSEGFLLQRLLSEEECLFLVNAAERMGFKSIKGATYDYRTSERIMVQSESLASVLWDRIRPHLCEIEISGDPHNVHIHGVDTLLQGTWKPLRLNNHFRLCKYHPGGHFSPHYDGFFTESSRVRSLISVVIYLNDDFDKGRTNFLRETWTDHMDATGKLCGAEEDVLHRVTPERGACLLFHHHRLHEGEAVESGVKYILRSDVMFEHVHTAALEPQQEKALHIAQEAERFECKGHQTQAQKLFSQAFQMFPVLEQSYS